MKILKYVNIFQETKERNIYNLLEISKLPYKNNLIKDVKRSYLYFGKHTDYMQNVSHKT